MIGWEKKPLRQVMPDGKIRGLGGQIEVVDDERDVQKFKLRVG